MKFDNITEIQNHEFVGNHASDCEAFNAINAFAEDTSNSVSDRAEALRTMTDKGMGLGREEHMNDEELVDFFMAGAEH